MKEAVESVVRLYESDEDIITYAPAENVLKHVMKTGPAKELASAADKRRKEIRNSKTTIAKNDIFVQGKTYTGAAYYVSNHGNDANDGLSEASAVKTFKRLHQIKLKFGDAIFLREAVSGMGQTGLTRTVCRELPCLLYGTGEKPRFYGPLENSAGKEK